MYEVRTFSFAHLLSSNSVADLPQGSLAVLAFQFAEGCNLRAVSSLQIFARQIPDEVLVALTAAEGVFARLLEARDRVDSA